MERKFIHIESESLELNTESVGDNANKIIIITRKKENFILTDDRKEELRKIVINFNESPEEKLWFDITTEKEKEFVDKLCEEIGIDFTCNLDMYS